MLFSVRSRLISLFSSGVVCYSPSFSREVCCSTSSYSSVSSASGIAGSRDGLCSGIPPKSGPGMKVMSVMGHSVSYIPSRTQIILSLFS